MTSVESIPPTLLGGVPVVQPPHLEGDPTLATEILPGPPSLHSLQQGHRKDTKKPSAPLSYLPVSDPGSTYSALAMGAGTTAIMNSSGVDGPRRKRARTNKGVSSTRPQRASARVLNASSSTTDMTTNGHEVAAAWSVQAQASQKESSMPSSVFDADEVMISPSNSEEDIQFVSAPTNRASSKDPAAVGRRDKGKGKEKEKSGALVRIKEEPSAIAFCLDDCGPSLPNEDHCSACQSLGSLVYCDGCPRAFHLCCLDPPMEPQDLPEGENRWFCPACVIQNNPPLKPPASLKFMSPLILQLQSTTPLEFRLPDDIRTAFKDVATGPRGTYVDSSEIKPPRLNRHGQLEDRDPRRLKDRSGVAILCFQCGMSVLPSDDIVPPPTKRPRRASSKLASTDTWKSMISCDYCDLSWHLDCLDPPVVNMPTFGVKWMCPNHAEQVHKPKRRIPKQNVAPIEITKSDQSNNGNIEITYNTLSLQEEKVLVDEISINGRRYRVPERVVKLDFWNKVNGIQPVEPMHESPLSSPLTSLSSLDDFDEPLVKSQSPRLYSLDDILAAQILWQAMTPVIPAEAVASPALNGTFNNQDESGVDPAPSRRPSPARSQGSPQRDQKIMEDHMVVEPTGPTKPVQDSATSTSPAAPREPSPPLEARNGRRRTTRRSAPSVKRAKIDLLDDTSSDSLPSPITGQPLKTAKPMDKSHAVLKSVPSLPKPPTPTASNAKSEQLSSATKPLNGSSKPTKTVPSNNLTASSTSPAPKSTKTHKTPVSIPKAGKPVSSVAAAPIRTESSTSPNPTASLKIRLPRLSDITTSPASTSAAAPPTPTRTNPITDPAKGSRTRTRLSRRHTSTSTSS